MKRETVKKETMAEEQKKAGGPAQPADKNQNEDWLKKLGAVPADQYYEDSPEIARIEEALSASEEVAARPAKSESLENIVNKLVCHHFARNMVLERLKCGVGIFCPVKVVLERAKTDLQDISESEKKMQVRPEYLPCHLCPKYYQTGKQLSKGYRLRKDQIEFLQEFDLLEERLVSSPRYSDKVNYSRKRTAERLEAKKLIRTVGRFLRNPANPQKPEPTVIANLSVMGRIASDKDWGFIEKDLLKVLEKPTRVVAEYVERLEAEMEHLGEFIKTRKQQRTRTGWDITLGIVELGHQYNLFTKYDAFLAENGASMAKILSPEDPVGGGQSGHHQS